MLFDLGARKFYIFDWVFWPQDVLPDIHPDCISAFCCSCHRHRSWRFWWLRLPADGYTEIFMWVEEKFEGDRAARMKLDQAPMSFAKAWRRAPHLGVS